MEREFFCCCHVPMHCLVPLKGEENARQYGMAIVGILKRSGNPQANCCTAQRVLAVGMVTMASAPGGLSCLRGIMDTVQRLSEGMIDNLLAMRKGNR